MEETHSKLNDEELKRKKRKIEDDLDKINKNDWIPSVQWKKWANSILIQHPADEVAELNKATTASRPELSGHSKVQSPTLNTVCNLIYTEYFCTVNCSKHCTVYISFINFKLIILVSGSQPKLREFEI